MSTAATGIPASKGGWWHDYVCPVHHVELDRPTDTGYPCVHGCLYRGEPYASAWTTLEHQKWARDLRPRARTGDVDGALAVLRDFAALYSSVAGEWSDQAKPWMLRGTLFAQALTEAIWGAHVADAVVALADSGDDVRAQLSADADIVKLLENLLGTMAAARDVLVSERDDLRSNYTAWLDAAGAIAARALARLGQPADVDAWRQRMFEHIRVAVKDDGWEWEGATYYHLFVLRAYLLNLGGSAPADLPADVADRLVKMLMVLVDLATPGGALPALHDSPYRRVAALREVVEVCVLGRQLCAVPGLATIEASARGALGDDDDRLEVHLGGWFTGPPLAAPPPPDRHRIHPDGGVAVLRSPDGSWQATIDIGVRPEDHGSHRHASQLSLYLYGTDEQWQPAPGVPPYASRLRRDYYATALAHPTLRIDGGDPQPNAARVTVDGNRVDAVAREAFPDAEVSRSLVMTSTCLVDVVAVRCGTEREISLGLRPGDELTVTADAVHGTWRTVWTSGTRRLIGVHLSPQETSLEISPGRGPSDDPSRLHSVADWTCRGAEVTFISAYTPVATGAQVPWADLVAAVTQLGGFDVAS